MGYLTFLIDNYENIPKSGVVFVHGSWLAWHNDEPSYDNAALLVMLNVPAALAPWGYHNLRCDLECQHVPAIFCSSRELGDVINVNSTTLGCPSCF